MKKPLSIVSLEQLDPRIVAEWIMHLKKIVEDCTDRSMLIKARKVKMTISVTPDEQDPHYVEVDFEISSDVPATTSRKFSMQPTGKGGLLFNPESLDEISQHTTDEEIERHRKD
ncbi:MAG: hypothetical protein ABFE01_04610 [Phycisphaerales bacterium]